MNIELANQAAQPTIYIRTRMTLENMTETFDTCYGKLMAYLSELGEPLAGAPYAAYYNSDMNDMDTEIGIPVAKPLPENGEINAGSIMPFEKVITATHKGSYSTLSETYDALYKHLADNKFSMIGPHYDFYISDPANIPENEMLTKVVLPVR